MKKIKINFKKENGAISLFILVSLLFFLVIVVSVGISLKNKSVSMDRKLNTIKQSYETDIGNEDELYKEKISIKVMPTETSVADASTTFSTEYGKIDVIWLSGTENTVSSTPNTPNLSGMTPVSWTKNGDTWTEDSTASASYYSYEAGSGNSDNTSSRWANAKNSTGYYDGWGQWRASDGKVRLALDSGIETVEYGGNKYIVHPAFCGTSVGYDNGSWSSDISGFWVAKYEMSRNDATDSNAGSGYNTTFLSVPNVQSARSITIGNVYNVAKS